MCGLSKKSIAAIDPPDDDDAGVMRQKRNFIFALIVNDT